MNHRINRGPRHVLRAALAAVVLAGGAVLSTGASALTLSPACTVPDKLLALTGDLGEAADHVATWGGLRVLAIGSSSTAGVGASGPGKTYPAQLQAELSKRLPGIFVRVINRGKGGEVAAQTAFRLRHDVLEYKPDLVIWQVGTNDALRHVESDAFAATLENGLAFLHDRKIDVILIDPQMFPRAADNLAYAALVQRISAIAGHEDVAVLHRFAAMKAWATLPEAVRRPMLSADGFHMGDQGYACLAQVLAEGIVRRLPETVADHAPAETPPSAAVARLAPVRE
ncbi:MAG TPA: SGNH/GDSL hydrolase family protein [Hyphomicrobiales bacterium]|nr:SGNH/GDSL hydrolase family protein [Hyphomicrobiales bacterium]